MTASSAPSYLTTRFLRLVGNAIAPRGKGDGRLCVINYHRILETAQPFLESEPDLATFRWHMRLLAESFNVMPLHDALLALADQRMPPRAVSITFDDGYRSVHDLALPVLKEFGLPATVFVTSGYIGENNMWNDRIIEAVQSLPTAELDLAQFGLGTYSLQDLDARKATVGELTEASKYLPPRVRLDLVEMLELLVGDGLAHGLMLTREMVASLAQQGIEIGGHTVSHPILTRLDDETCRYEIAGGKQQLEAITGKPVRLFAYPNGKVGMDFNERHAQMAKEAGFSAAFTTATGAVTSKQDRFQLPRARPWDATPFLFGVRLLRWLAA